MGIPVVDLGKQRYKVRLRKTGKLFKNTIHCSRLKHYIQPQNDLGKTGNKDVQDDLECGQLNGTEEKQVRVDKSFYRSIYMDLELSAMFLHI